MSHIQPDRLKTFIDRLESLEEEKSQVLEGLKEVFSEARSDGFDIKTMKKVLKLRQMRREKIEEEDNLLETYRQALGI